MKMKTPQIVNITIIPKINFKVKDLVVPLSMHNNKMLKGINNKDPM
jgi:hypothetical protein